MTTPDQGVTKKHLVYALSVSDGSVRSGFPVDVSQALSGKGLTFQSEIQNQRGGLALLNGAVYVSYGGHYGDCGSYHGWIVGIPVTNPSGVMAWSTPGLKGGIWAPGGIASDGTSLYASTGNTEGVQSWSGGEAVLRFPPSLVFEQSSQNYFSPSNWLALDDADTDIGSAGPVFFTLPGATPSQLILEMGKNGNVYLLDPSNLGGVGSGLVSQHVSSLPIITAPTIYTSGNGTFVAAKGKGTNCPAGQSGDIFSLRINPGSPPTLSTAWCALQGGMGSLIATTSDGMNDAMVFGIGAEGDNRLRAFDGDTGAVIFTSDPLTSIHRYQTPIVAKGRVFVATDNRLYAFLTG
jgi:hypothetical protein